MPFMTARKRARGLGAARTGTDHFWRMTVSSVGLVILVPLFIFTFGPALGAPYEEVMVWFSRPFPAVVAALTLAVGWLHFKNGARVMIEDYFQGFLRQALIITVTCISYAALAAGLFALVRLAL